MLKMLNSWLMRCLISPAIHHEIGKNGGYLEMDDRDDGLNFFWGLILAIGLSSVLWGFMVILVL